MSRVQLALNVEMISTRRSRSTPNSLAFTRRGRPGYANFAVTEPPLKLVLLENPGKGGTINHLGVEVEPARRCTPRSPA